MTRMRITRVDALLMSCPLPEPLRLPFHGGERTILKRDAMLIRVRTDVGITGYAPGPAHERAAREITDVIAPWLDGRNPLNWASFAFEGDHEVMKTYRAVELAVMDAAARYEGAPLSELAGGRCRDTIKVCGSAGMYMPPEAYAAEAAAIQAMGFPAYKMRPALGPEEDLRTIALMRAATGPAFGLMIDAHSWWRMGDHSYSYETVRRLAGEMAPHDVVWLEEPLPPDDHDAYRRLRGEVATPLATGEHEQDDRGLLDLIDTGAASYVQMDICCQGGLPTFTAVTRAAQDRGVRFAFHCWGTSLEVLVAAHLGVCWPASVVEWLEHPCHGNQGRPGMYPFQLADDILAAPLPVVDGHLVVPDGPGLGMTVDESVIDRYPFVPGPWSLFRLDSPPSTVAVTGDHSVTWVDAPAQPGQ
jgi:L-alanine-DL-glutamate epimerase-like enolase superfamily enzyme